MAGNSLEQALADVENSAEQSIKAINLALKGVKRVKTAAASGQIADLQKALTDSSLSGQNANMVIEELVSKWTFDADEWFTSGNFSQELIEMANELSVKVYESDERLLSYPVIVEISANDTSVLIDKKKVKTVRPSKLINILKALQQKQPKFKPEAFIESLALAYDLVVGKSNTRQEAAVKLIEIHKVLTLLPGASRDYTRQEFARDIYLLDQSGVVITKDGRVMTLPASAMTRGSGVLSTVSKNGQPKLYVGIAFAKGVK